MMRKNSDTIRRAAILAATTILTASFFCRMQAKQKETRTPNKIGNRYG